jgi:hypothetical protein
VGAESVRVKKEGEGRVAVAEVVSNSNACCEMHALPLFSSQFIHPNSTMQKEDSLSYRNAGTCMEY